MEEENILFTLTNLHISILQEIFFGKNNIEKICNKLNMEEGGCRIILCYMTKSGFIKKDKNNSSYCLTQLGMDLRKHFAKK